MFRRQEAIRSVYQNKGVQPPIRSVWEVQSHVLRYLKICKNCKICKNGKYTSDNYDGVRFYVFYSFNVSNILIFVIVPSRVMYWCFHSFTFQTPC